ncbi:MAG: SRPBCC family protein [Microbacteriaceae bacterium]|nr:SRPBCC family protein [Microbacteriaceae bacterium]
MSPDQPRSAIVSLKSDTEIVITRAFAAPRERVFEAWTTPEHVRRWYGEAEMRMTACEIDLRVGGRWRYVLEQANGGGTHEFSGEFIDVTPPECLITTERYDALPGGVHVNTMTLTEEPGVTTMHLHAKYGSRADRDERLGDGMEDGVQSTLDRFAALLASLAPGR